MNNFINQFSFRQSASSLKRATSLRWGQHIASLALSLLAGSAWAQAATTTALTSSVNPSYVGQNTTLTATVSPSAAPGTVTFRSGTTVLGTSPVNAGVATFVRAFSSTGTHNLTAAYSGDVNNGYAASTSPVRAQTVSAKIVTTTALTSSINPSAVNQNTTLTATVTPSAATGTITFKEGSTTLGTATLNAGVASLPKSFTVIGAHSLTAVYAGSVSHVGSTSAARSHTVSGPALPAMPAASAPVTKYEYDAEGNLTKTVQAPGVSGLSLETKNNYDSLERLKDSTDPKLGVTQFAYNGREDLTQVTDPRNLVTKYPRNGLGDATQLVSPDTGTATQTYDAAGNLKTRTDSRGVLATYTYDALNRMTQVVYSQSGQTSLTTSWGYDLTGTNYANSIGRLSRTDHPAGASRYLYDPQGRITESVQAVSATTGANTVGINHSVKYTYDSAGRTTSITYPSGRQVRYTYTNGELTGVGLAATATSTPTTLLSQIQWEPFGALKSWSWQMDSGAQAHTRAYDSSGRLVRYRLFNTVRDLTYDAADRITAYTHYDATTGAAQTSLNQSFGYDKNGQLTNITTATASWSITYDANGNRTGVTLNGTTSTYTTPATSNKLASITNPARSLSYDNAGNTTADTGNYTAAYDLSGRMKTLTKAGVTSTYSYNAQGQRVRKFSSSGASSTVIFVYGQGGELLGEYSNTGVAIREYVWVGSTPVAIFTPNGTNPPVVHYIYTDHLDTPRVVTSTSGGLRWRWMAEPFGTTAPETNPAGLGAFTQNLRFPGQYFGCRNRGSAYNWYPHAMTRQLDATTPAIPLGLMGESIRTHM